MKKVKYLCIRFKNEVGFQELRKFRGAVIEVAGRDHVLFHNHADGNFRYSYPLIQYKRAGARAALVCLEEGVHEVHAFFQGRPRTLWLGDREIVPEVESMQMKEVNLQVWDKPFHYRLQNWLALSQEHYPVWQDMTDETERRRFLTSILTGNLLSMAKGLDWNVDREIKVQFHYIGAPQLIRFKEQSLTSFQARFSANIWLPPYLGLGKGAALGYGMASPDKQFFKQAQVKHDESQLPRATGNPLTQ